MRETGKFFVSKLYARIIGSCYALMGIAFMVFLPDGFGSLPVWVYKGFGGILAIYGLVRVFRKQKTNE